MPIADQDLEAAVRIVEAWLASKDRDDRRPNADETAKLFQRLYNQVVYRNEANLKVRP